MPTRLRTPSELAERLGRMSILDTSGVDDSGVRHVPAAGDPFAARDPHGRDDLPRRLSTEDWRRHEEESTGLRPDAYAAVIGESDVLAGACPGGPTSTS